VLGILRGWIAQGRFRNGQALPSERALAAQLSVARVTVRAALAELAREGLLDSSPGRKRRVGGLAESGLMAQTVAMLSTASVDELRTSAPHGYDTLIHYQAARTIEQAGFNVLILNPQRLLDGGLAHLLAQRPAGVLVTHGVGESPEGQRLVASCVASGLPVAAYGYSPSLSNCDTVSSDQERGSYEIARWLLARGCRRILRVWRFAGNFAWLDQRSAGYERAMREAGLEPLPAVRTRDLGCDVDARGFDEAARAIGGAIIEHVCGTQPIDAIMTATDPHAIQAAAALRLFAKRPNHDVLLAGYDNTWRGNPGHAFEAEGPLVTVDKNDRQIGTELATLLLDRLAGKLPPAPQHRVVPGTFLAVDRAESTRAASPAR
jgi:DNA-binding LacI/PurR family transcriptional regulator